MTCSRSAILMLTACIVLAAAAHTSQSTESPADKTQLFVSGHTGISIVGPHSSLLPRGATLSRFTPWRTRLKSVLPETDPKIVEECDCGSAFLPDRPITSALGEPASCPFTTRAPLAVDFDLPFLSRDIIRDRRLSCGSPSTRHNPMMGATQTLAGPAELRTKGQTEIPVIQSPKWLIVHGIRSGRAFIRCRGQMVRKHCPRVARHRRVSRPRVHSTCNRTEQKLLDAGVRSAERVWRRQSGDMQSCGGARCLSQMR